jgi:uracil-DNA glycosylase
MDSSNPQSFREFLIPLPPIWREKLSSFVGTTWAIELNGFLDSEYKAGKQIFPKPENVLRALRELDLPNVNVVILGQDPYHGPNQAIGFSFAVPNDLRLKPPSLKNIFKEVESDLGVKLRKDESDLTGWVQQGVLLLNTVLTVEAPQPLSHRDRGWENFTDQVIACLNEREDPVVFVLWGSHAQKFKTKIDLKRHAVLESAHPSPLSAYRGFLGSKVFSRVNALLVKMNKQPIDWTKISI